MQAYPAALRLADCYDRDDAQAARRTHAHSLGGRATEERPAEGALRRHEARKRIGVLWPDHGEVALAVLVQQPHPRAQSYSLNVSLHNHDGACCTLPPADRARTCKEIVKVSDRMSLRHLACGRPQTLEL